MCGGGEGHMSVGWRGRGTWVCGGGEGHMGVWRRGGAYEYNGNGIGGVKLHTV